ncbi:MAG: TetR/AcrR family transcriptional regulator [Deltaproteobacteria bacterium]|nr:TetR/AcrR family transcriptional regulator [Deltaproteobacteria bacterium]
MPSQTASGQERADQTRKAILDATVDSLVELGFARTSTAEVQRRAGMSRGALLHHFPSKAVLLASAVNHLTLLRALEIKDRAAELPALPARIDAVLDLLWESFSGPLFSVSIELRNAARTDDELRAVLAETELAMRRGIFAQSRLLFGDQVASSPGFDTALDLTLQLMAGAATTNLLHDRPDRLGQLIDEWKRLFPMVLDGARRLDEEKMK